MFFCCFRLIAHREINRRLAALLMADRAFEAHVLPTETDKRRFLFVALHAGQINDRKKGQVGRVGAHVVPFSTLAIRIPSHLITFTVTALPTIRYRGPSAH